MSNSKSVLDRIVKYLRAQPKGIFIDGRVILGFVNCSRTALTYAARRHTIQSRKGPGGGYRLSR